MVRLKAKKEGLVRKNYRISIPYGAIKSKIAARSNASFPIFQFLMVRLKVIMFFAI